MGKYASHSGNIVALSLSKFIDKLILRNRRKREGEKEREREIKKGS